jgi:ketosteroid isomerase-like protein
MTIDDRRRPPASATEAGLDHVRLSYLYRDDGDLDGFGSLLHEDVLVTRPDAPQRRGRAEVLRLHHEIADPAVRHHIYKIIADGDCVAVLGRLSAERGTGAGAGVDFADFFTLSHEGMLLGYRRFYFASPD